MRAGLSFCVQEKTTLCYVMLSFSPFSLFSFVTAEELLRGSPSDFKGYLRGLLGKTQAGRQACGQASKHWLLWYIVCASCTCFCRLGTQGEKEEEGLCFYFE